MGALGTALAAGSSGVGGAVVAAGVVVGTNACHVRKEKCKRSVSSYMFYMKNLSLPTVFIFKRTLSL